MNAEITVVVPTFQRVEAGCARLSTASYGRRPAHKPVRGGRDRRRARRTGRSTSSARSPTGSAFGTCITTVLATEWRRPATRARGRLPRRCSRSWTRALWSLAGSVEAHLRAHKAAELAGSTTVVVGRVASYDNRTATEDAGSAAQDRPWAEPAGDMRDEELDRFSRTLENTCLPWRLAWTANLSVDAKVFASVGGFDERFTGWGAEDMELAYRLHRFGARFCWSDEACAVECPHPRDMPSNIVSNRRNQQLFYELHPEPEIEVFIAARRTGQDVHDARSPEYRAWAAAAAAAKATSATRGSQELGHRTSAGQEGAVRPVGARVSGGRHQSVRRPDHVTAAQPVHGSPSGRTPHPAPG